MGESVKLRIDWNVIQRVQTTVRSILCSEFVRYKFEGSNRLQYLSKFNNLCLISQSNTKNENVDVRKYLAIYQNC